MRLIALAAAVLALGLAPAAAQGPATEGAQQPGPAPLGAVPTGEVPGPDSEIIGPEGSFRLKPDGVEWARFQGQRAIGVVCTEAACGQDRVFCLIQVRAAPDARAGEAPTAESAATFGAGVLRNAPKGLTADYLAPFAARTLGPNAGQWAEVKAEGEPGSLDFGLFLTSAEKHLVAFNCVSPTAKWDAYKPKFEALLASLKITK